MRDNVYLSKIGAFNEKYPPNWTNTVNFVRKVQPTSPETHILNYTNRQLLYNGFYEHEMSTVVYRCIL